ncbi:MAG: ATP-binding protein [Acidobacteriota bacterium]
MAWRLHDRIAFSFAVVALVATVPAASVALLVISDTFEARMVSQALNTADVLGRGGLALNESVIENAKAITGADLVAFDESGTVIASTLDAARGDLARTVVAATLASPPAEEQAATLRSVACDVPCHVAVRRLAGRPDRLLAIVAQASDLDAAMAAVTRVIAVATLLALATMVIVSRLVARRVIAPIEDLAAIADSVAGGAPPQRAREGPDEVGRLGRAFNHMIDRVEESQTALVRSEKLALTGLLAARVAHEIRNPLSAIKLQTQLLGRDVAGRPDAQALVDAVLRDIRKVEAVIADLIELARPGEPRVQAAQINTLVADVLGEMEPQLTHRRIVVTRRLADGLPDVSLDRGRVARALVNLIANSAEAMPDGGHLTIATALDEPARSIVLEVCDDGAGIDPAMRDRLFSPFATSKPDGVGLGLVNARAIVEQHGGTIRLESPGGGGTRAIIRLPYSG